MAKNKYDSDYEPSPWTDFKADTNKKLPDAPVGICPACNHGELSGEEDVLECGFCGERFNKQAGGG